MSVPRDLIEENPGLGEWCILHGYRGSTAYGTYVPGTSRDRDTTAICVPTRDYYSGLRSYGSQGTKEIARDEWDIVTFEARKALRLFMAGNPNVMELLWLAPNYYIKRRDAGDMLIDNRHLFMTRALHQPFAGYANAQLLKMTRLDKRGYMGEKRKALVDEHGYDTKNAAHLIRLLRMAIEALRDGELIVDRGGYDANELLAIKRGEWDLERVWEEAERLFRRAEDACDRSSLPARPDWDKVNRLCMEVVDAELRRRGE